MSKRSGGCALLLLVLLAEPAAASTGAETEGGALGRIMTEYADALSRMAGRCLRLKGTATRVSTIKLKHGENRIMRQDYKFCLDEPRGRFEVSLEDRRPSNTGRMEEVYCVNATYAFALRKAKIEDQWSIAGISSSMAARTDETFMYRMGEFLLAPICIDEYLAEPLLRSDGFAFTRATPPTTAGFEPPQVRIQAEAESEGVFRLRVGDRGPGKRLGDAGVRMLPARTPGSSLRQGCGVSRAGRRDSGAAARYGYVPWTAVRQYLRIW